jgi:membrane protein YqaA with SNARE-associated domain
VIRRLYDWVLGWADSPWGMPALFILAFAEASFFPVPPDVLLIALVLGNRSVALRAALLCLAGSLLGGLLGYWIGFASWDLIGAPLVAFYHGEHVMDKVKHWADLYGFWGVFLAALTPIPYKVFTISAGVFHFNLAEFIFASICGRGLRFGAVALLIRMFGEPVRGFIDRWFNALALAFGVLLVGGFFLLSLF